MHLTRRSLSTPVTLTGSLTGRLTSPRPMPFRLGKPPRQSVPLRAEADLTSEAADVGETNGQDRDPKPPDPGEIRATQNGERF